MPRGALKSLTLNVFRSIVAATMACVVACGSHTHAAGPSPAKASPSIAQSTLRATPVPSAAPTTTPQCIGLSICRPPPPDAEGYPPCYYADGWRTDGSGAGIEVWYFHDPQAPAKPDKITAQVRRKDGTNQSQDADIDAGQQVHRFEFPDIEQSSVGEVLLTSSAGRCFVIGPGG